MSEAPAELWLRQNDAGDYYVTSLRDAVRYVRADLYEAALALAERRVEAAALRLAVVRSWNEAPCLEPLGTDYPR